MLEKKRTRFDELGHRVDSTGDGGLPPEHIKTVEDDLTDRQQELYERGQVLATQIKLAMESHHTDTIKADTIEFRQIQFEHGCLERDRKRPYYKRQQRIIWRGFRTQLGERGAEDNVIYSGCYPFTLWWTFNTVSTGGFGDLYKPASPLAQLVTGAQIISGFVVLGVFIATLSAALKGEDTEEMWRIQKQIVTKLGDLQQSLDQAHRRIEALQSGNGDLPDPFGAPVR